MKITKSELKSIVKECLVELLSEGLGTSLEGSKNSSTRQASLPVPFTENLKRQQQKTISSGLKETIRREAGGNKIMEDIFADTAASTLPSFLQNEGKSPVPAAVGGGLAEQVVARVNPEDLFGDDVTSKWASLAFAESPLKK